MLFIGLLCILTGLSLSAVAAYFSIIGIAEFFSASFLPVVIMASFIEAAKIVAALWLHRHWSEAPKKLRTYLVTSVLVIMFITSLGIFGFLSKSHISKFEEREIIQSKITAFQSQIELLNRQKETYANNLEILDRELERLQANNRITQSIQVRQAQTRERNDLIINIRNIENQIFQINQQISDLRLQNISHETKLGPLRYFVSTVEMFTGHKMTDQVASQVFILLIIFVFDPVAICLIIAGQWSLIERSRRKEITRRTTNQKIQKDADPGPFGLGYLNAFYQNNANKQQGETFTNSFSSNVFYRIDKTLEELEKNSKVKSGYGYTFAEVDNGVNKKSFDIAQDLENNNLPNEQNIEESEEIKKK